MTASASPSPASTDSGPDGSAASARRGGPRRRRAAAEPTVTDAVVFATAAADDDGPAADLPWEGATVLRRLVEQLESVGIRRAHVVVRAEWEAQLAPSLDVPGIAVDLHPSADAAGDLRTLATLARDRTGGLLLLGGEIVTHREALAGLVLDPRLRTAILSGYSPTARPFVPRVRNVRGRVVSAGSAYHTSKNGNANFLGVLKVAPPDQPLLADVADRLAALAADTPAAWEEEHEFKVGSWRRWLAYRLQRQAGVEEPEVSERPELPADEEAEVRRRDAASQRDPVSLALVGLVREGAVVTNSYLRALFWARPLSPAAVARAADDIQSHDEDKVLLQSAVKGNDGFFTTYFVSPYSRYIARWAAHRGLTPNFVTTVSVLIGAVAAACFATGDRWGMIVGAVLLQASFTTDCVDGQLARYTRQFSALGAWLDSVFDRTKEYMVFAGLAIGATQTGDDIWLLAAVALALQTVRHTLEFAYAAGRHQAIAAVRHSPLEHPFDNPNRPLRSEREDERDDDLEGGDVDIDAAAPGGPTPRKAVRHGLRLWTTIERIPGIRWSKKIIAFPIGERFALISILAATTSPRTTLTVYLAWAGLAAAYTVTGRTLRSLAR